MDLGTGLALFGSAQVVEKLLGPTAAYIGTGVKDWTERRVQNVSAIFANAARKLGAQLDNDGAVPPKVLKEILAEGSFSEDAIATEYFGGVLASSRTNVARDDRAATFTSLVARMSTYQLRAHYICYRSLRETFLDSGRTLNVKDRPHLQISIPLPALLHAMDMTPEESVNLVSLFEHIFFGMSRENLIENFQYGALDKEVFPWAVDSGVLFQPTVLGAELFLRAHGHANLGAGALLLSSTATQFDATIPATPGCKHTPQPKNGA